jgi:Transposase DDE domain group 1
MGKVKAKIPKELQKGIPLKTGPNHTVRLEVTDEALTVHTGLSLFYAMAEALEIPRTLDEHVKVKQRESGYPESEHILALAANAFVGGDYLEDLEALREDVAIQRAIGRKDLPDPTTAGDFCRRFTLGHLLQVNRAFGEMEQRVYERRPEVTHWTVDADAKVHEVYGEKKQGAAKSYNGIYSLQPMYGFVHETDEMIHCELRSGNTHPGAGGAGFLRRLKRKVPSGVKSVHLRSDSAFYNKDVVEFCEKGKWTFTITADQTGPLMKQIEGLPESAWEKHPKDESLSYGEVQYQPVKWDHSYRYLVRRVRKVPKSGQSGLFEVMSFSYYVIVTNREEDIQEVLELHDKRGMSERRIAEFTNEFLFHLPMEGFMSNWVYLLCAQLAYNLSLWIRDLVLPPFYRKKHIKRIRRTIGLIASKVTHGGHQIRLKISVLHRWWRDFVYGWQRIPQVKGAPGVG